MHGDLSSTFNPDPSCSEIYFEGDPLFRSHMLGVNIT